MRCRTCDYRLWNLFTRRCPECGTPFKPSDFDFTLNSVQFRCPHCGQSYYGTGERGHLVPVEFDCSGCGRHIHMDEMVLFPTEGVQEEQTKIRNAPWVERAERGRVRAWFSTVGMALVRPGQLMDLLPEEGGTGQAIIFGLLSTILIMLVSAGPFTLFPILIFASGIAGPGMWMGVVGMVIGMLFWVGAMVALMFIWALTVHGLLRVTGETAGKLGYTYQAVFYGSGANVGSAVPCLGFYVGWIWWLVSTILMIKQRQRVSGGRAAFAALTFPILLIGGGVGTYVWFIMSVMAGLGPAMVATAPAGMGMPGGSPFAVQSTNVVLNAVLGYAEDHERSGPGHAAELVAAGYLTGGQLIAPESQTKLDRVPVGTKTLAEVLAMRRDPARAAAKAAAEALPSKTIAHRVGDWVFTYHGITLGPPPDGGLWIAVRSPDPDSNPEPSTIEVVAWCADGTPMVFSGASLAWGLRQQNALRRRHGLLPLPDPREVTHDRPAVASDRRPR